MRTRFEIKQIGTLLFLFVDGVPRECCTMHDFCDRQGIFMRAVELIRKEHEKENKYRKLYRGNEVTIESYTQKVACQHIHNYMFWDGSRTHPLIWPESSSIAIL